MSKEKPVIEVRLNKKLYEMTTPQVAVIVKWLHKTAKEIEKHYTEYTNATFRYFERKGK